MRYWGRNIQIDGTWYHTPNAAGKARPPVATDQLVKSYEKDVQDILRRIASTRVGGLILRLINQRSTKTLRFIPNVYRAFNPGARPVNPARGQKEGIGDPAGCPSKEKSVGGTDVVISIEPKSWRGGLPKSSGIDPHGLWAPDDILVHEAFHALRYMKGIVKRTPMGDGWTEREEFYAMIIANIYRSEKGQPVNALRAWHRGRTFRRMVDVLGGELPSADLSFYMTYESEINCLCREMPEVCGPLGRPRCSNTMLRCTWNPIYAGVVFNKRSMAY